MRISTHLFDRRPVRASVDVIVLCREGNVNKEYVHLRARDKWKGKQREKNQLTSVLPIVPLNQRSSDDLVGLRIDDGDVGYSGVSLWCERAKESQF